MLKNYENEHKTTLRLFVSLLRIYSLILAPINYKLYKYANQHKRGRKSLKNN